jgi:alpha-L-rhamnosidase
MVPENEIENVVNGLVHDIVEVKGGHHSTGIHGNRYIYTVLTKYGHGDLAHQILTTPDFPSQTYVMNSGFTTWPERQFEWEKMEGPTNSLNHPMHSGFSAYFYEALGGIKSSKANPGYKEFIVDPEFPSNITSTDVSIPTPYGDIQNSWFVKDGSLTMNIEVPFNTTTVLPLNDTQKKSLSINDEDWKKFQHESSTAHKLILGSGVYKIRYLK